MYAAVRRQSAVAAYLLFAFVRRYGFTANNYHHEPLLQKVHVWSVNVVS